MSVDPDTTKNVIEAPSLGQPTIHSDAEGMYRLHPNGFVERLYPLEPMVDMTDIAQKAFVYYDLPRPLPPKKEKPWVALFVDGDGLGSDVKINQVLKQSEQLGEVVVKRVYGNYQIPAKYTRWKSIHEKFQFERRVYIGVHKNIADHGIVAEMIELALTKPEIDFFVLVSHDGGFFPLMAKMAQIGKRIFWIGGQAPLKKVEQLRKEVDTERQRPMNNSL